MPCFCSLHSQLVLFHKLLLFGLVLQLNLVAKCLFSHALLPFTEEMQATKIETQDVEKKRGNMYSQSYVHPQHLGTHPVGKGAGEGKAAPLHLVNNN